MPEILTLKPDLKHLERKERRERKERNIPKNVPRDNPAQNFEFMKFVPKLAFFFSKDLP